jgi:hypothetical protein
MHRSIYPWNLVIEMARAQQESRRLCPRTGASPPLSGVQIEARSAMMSERTP